MKEKKDKFTRRELYDAVWSKPVDKLAAEFGISGRGLGKLCERHGVPVPPRGYWAKKVAGKRVVRPPLIEIEAGSGSEISISIRPRCEMQSVSAGVATETVADPFKEVWEGLVAEAREVRIPTTLSSPHRIVAAWIEEDRQRSRSPIWSTNSSKRSSPLEKRRLRILSTLLKQLEARGFVIERDRYRQTDLRARHGRDEVPFYLGERIRQYRRELTEAERARGWNANQRWTQVREPTGELFLKVACSVPASVPSSWKDETDRPLESKLRLVIAAFVVAAAYAKHTREVRDAEEHRRWQAQQEVWRREEERKAELARKKVLCDRARAWREAAEIRAYVTAVQMAVEAGTLAVSAEEFAVWSSWALEHAREIDPIASNTATSTSVTP
jgi:hypothetical protein